MNNKVNIKEIYRKIVSERYGDDSILINAYILTINEIDRDVMKEACRQTLELAAENAETQCDEGGETGFVNKKSILDTINQIE